MPYATGLCLLAEVLAAQDELNDADTLVERGIEIRQVLWKRHPDYAGGVDQRVRLMLRWDDLDGAEQLLARALEILKHTVGESHPDYAAQVSWPSPNCWTARTASRPLQESTLRDALAIRTEALGESHPDVARTLCRLRADPVSIRPARRGQVADRARARDLRPRAWRPHPDHKRP